MLYAFFWVITWRLVFKCRRFGTLCLFHLHRQVDVSRIYLHAKKDQTECFETSVCKLQTLGNYPKESIQLDKRNLRLAKSSLVFLISLRFQTVTGTAHVHCRISKAHERI